MSSNHNTTGSQAALGASTGAGMTGGARATTASGTRKKQQAYAVIDERMLADAMEVAMKQQHEDRKKEHEELPIRAFDEPTPPHLTEELTLSFRNIRKIDNLTTFDALRVLRLDNNAIQVVENLGHLLNLTWLDLSFNNISRLEGLETLTNLTDLTLFNNSISEIQGVQTLTKLQVLSLGNNSIKNLESVLGLRKLSSLAVLNLDGNDVCAEPDYRSRVIAYLPALEYLDYSMIEKQERTHAHEQHQDAVADLAEEEKNEQATLEKEAEFKARHIALDKAGILPIDKLLDLLWSNTEEAERLQKLPGIEHLSTSARDSTTAMVDEIVGKAQTLAAELDVEQATIVRAIENLVDQVLQKSIVAARNLEKQKKTLLREASSRNEHITSAIGALRGKVSDLKFQLMDLEGELGEQVSEMINDYESRYLEIAAKRKEVLGAFFREMEDSLNAYKEAVLQKVAVLLEQVKDGADLGGDLDEDTELLLSDKDTVVGLVTARSDYQVSKLLESEDHIRLSEKARQAAAVDGLRVAQKERNRQRVTEILKLEEHLKQQLDVLEAEAQGAEDEEDD